MSVPLFAVRSVRQGEVFITWQKLHQSLQQPASFWVVRRAKAASAESNANSQHSVKAAKSVEQIAYCEVS